MATVVTFGEIMLRLTTPRFERFTQATSFDATFGGAEANVAVNLCNLGITGRFVTFLPENPLGDATLKFLRSHGVDTRYVSRAEGRLGKYFVEKGAVQRPSKVLYDRGRSCIAEARPGSVDWDAVFEDADWFHWTGITPAISGSAAALCREAVKAASENEVTISCDLNYRSKLWKWGKPAGEVMPELVQYADVAIGNEEDADKVFGIRAPRADVERGEVNANSYRHVAEKLMERFPNLNKVAITLRGSLSASHNTWNAVLFNGEEFLEGPEFDIMPIVDRVGGGDSFAAGLVFCLLRGKDDRDALNFGVAASCLKHTMHGDANLATAAEIEDLLERGGGGRVRR